MISKNRLVEKLSEEGLGFGKDPDGTLRYYRHVGLIGPSTLRSDGPGCLAAFYPDHTLIKLRQIKNLQRLGCSLKEIQQIFLVEQGKEALATIPDKDGRVIRELSKSGKEGLLSEGLIKKVEESRKVLRESEKEWKHHLGIGRGLNIAKELMLLAAGIREKGFEAAGVVPMRDKKGNLKALTLELKSFEERLLEFPRNPVELPGEKTKKILSQNNRRKKK